MKTFNDIKSNEIEALNKLPDNEIDTSDIKELSNINSAVRGKFYKPVKKQITLRVDADLLAWYKNKGKGYQTRMNEALREFVKNHT